MSIRIRVYPQKNSVGARRVRAQNQQQRRFAQQNRMMQRQMFAGPLAYNARNFGNFGGFGRFGAASTGMYPGAYGYGSQLAQSWPNPYATGFTPSFAGQRFAQFPGQSNYSYQMNSMGPLGMGGSIGAWGQNFAPVSNAYMGAGFLGGLQSLFGFRL